MFSCLQINCQPFYLRQLLKFYPFDWLIEIYLQTEGQGTHQKMVSLQPMPGSSFLLSQYTLLNFRKVTKYEIDTFTGSTGIKSFHWGLNPPS